MLLDRIFWLVHTLSWLQSCDLVISGCFRSVVWLVLAMVWNCLAAAASGMWRGDTFLLYFCKVAKKNIGSSCICATPPVGDALCWPAKGPEGTAWSCLGSNSRWVLGKGSSPSEWSGTRTGSPGKWLWHQASLAQWHNSCNFIFAID